jgi:transposase
MKGGLNTKLHAVTDAKRRQLRFFMTAGQVSDYTGAAALLSRLPAAEWLIADRRYDADWFRDALKDKGTHRCIPGRKSHGKIVRYDERRYSSDATGSRSCSVVCRAGAGSGTATADAQRSSFTPSPSL